MVRKRNIDADLLKQAISNMPIIATVGSNNGYYGNQPIDQMMDSKIQQAIHSSLTNFKFSLLQVIEDSAMLHSACVLCAQKEGECLPDKMF